MADCPKKGKLTKRGRVQDRVQNAVFTSILQLRNSCFRNSGFATINAPHMMGFGYHSGAYCKDNLMLNYWSGMLS